MEYKTMKKLYKLLILLFIIYLNGCHPNPSIFITNISNDIIFVTENNKKSSLKNGDTYKSKFYSKNNQEIRININNKNINIRELLSEIEIEYSEKLNMAYPKGTGDLYIIIKNKNIYLGGIIDGELERFSVQPNKFPRSLE
jgi:hypothetical protein